MTTYVIKPNHPRAMRLAVTLAVIAALAYVLIAAGILGVGDRKVAQDGGAIVYVAAGCYVLGGLLILINRRWLWIVGAVINLLVMLFFFQMYQDRPAVLFSPGGLLSKTAQLLLEVVLLYLIVAGGRRARQPADQLV